MRKLYTLALAPEEVKEELGLTETRIFDDLDFFTPWKTETCFHFEDILNEITHREFQTLKSAPEEVKEEEY